MLCRAVPCCAVLCRAVRFCAALSLSYNPGNIDSKHEELAVASVCSLRALFHTAMAISCLHFPFLFLLEQTSSSGTYAATNGSTASVCTSTYVVEPRAQLSTARCPVHMAPNQVPTEQGMYQNYYVRTCMLRPVCFPGAWCCWYLQVDRLNLICWTIHFITFACHSNPFFV